MVSFIPAGVFDLYDEVVDDMINTLGVNCIISYPPINEVCVECSSSTIGNRQANSRSHGGPNWVVMPGCNYCAGTGFREKVNTDNIQLRVYFEPKDFIKIVPTVDIPANSVQVIGFISDLPKFNRSDWIEVNSAQSQITGTLRYQRSQQALPHGFRRNRYFVAMLEKS